MTLGNRLAEARKKAGLTQAQLASRLSVVQSAVSAWEKGSNEPTLETLRQIALETNVRVEWLAFGITMPASVWDESLAPIPIFDTRTAALSLDHRDTAQPSLLFDPGWLKTITDAPSQDLAIIHANGDGMDDIMASGDLVLLDLRIKKIGAPAIYAIHHHASEEVRIARCQRQLKTGKLRIFVDNPRYAVPEDDVDDVDIIVIGKAIWIGRRL